MRGPSAYRARQTGRTRSIPVQWVPGPRRPGHVAHPGGRCTPCVPSALDAAIRHEHGSPGKLMRPVCQRESASRISTATSHGYPRARTSAFRQSEDRSIDHQQRVFSIRSAITSTQRGRVGLNDTARQSRGSGERPVEPGAVASLRAAEVAALAFVAASYLSGFTGLCVPRTGGPQRAMSRRLAQRRRQTAPLPRAPRR